jgi:serine/threonine protein kinase
VKYNGKTDPMASEDAKEDIEMKREAYLMTKLRHPNIIQVLYSTALCSLLYSTALCSLLYSTALYSLLYSTALCSLLYSTALCSLLYSTALCSLLYSTALCSLLYSRSATIEHVVQFFALSIHEGALVLVMELMAFSFRDLLNDDPKELTLAIKGKILHGTALGLKYLHSRSPMVIHRDLKVSSRSTVASSRSTVASSRSRSAVVNSSAVVNPELYCY